MDRIEKEKTNSKNFTQSSDSLSIIQNAWETYVEKGIKPESLLRSEILSSWERSMMFGVNPFQKQVNKNVNTNELVDRQAQNEKLLSFAKRDMEYFLQPIRDSETIITISDKNGLILDTYGNQDVYKQAEKINFLPGAIWSEEVAGTNAIGTVIKNKMPVQILFTEHFSVGWHDWFCAAAPIINPLTDELMGVLDLSGKWKNINQHTLGLAISKARNITKHIEGILYYEGLQRNPFLVSALEALEDGLMIVNKNTEVLKMNKRMKSLLKEWKENESSLFKNYGEIDSMIRHVLHKKDPRIEEEILLYKDHYIVTINPVSEVQQNILGVVISFRKSLRRQKIWTKEALQPPKKIQYTFENMIGSSPVFMKTIQKAKKAALLDSTLLLHGETGTGKELFAQAIHVKSPRYEKPFIAINCGAIPRELIESELFGYEPGAFTGAKQQGNAGKFELANGGTIFLDEIGDMPLEVQVHLLRVLEERVVTRIGGSKPVPVNVRVIAATHRNLVEAVQKGTFREDLLFRLRVIQINIPSLRNRKEDIPLLATHYINQLAGNYGVTKEINLHHKTMEKLMNYSWPGNIREFRNVMEQALFNMEEHTIYPFDLPTEVSEEQGSEVHSERERLIEAIQASKGNMTQAAQRLGISRATIYRRLKHFGISTEQLKEKSQ
ncbi:MAG TPA: sigma-54-dependent Fis family transcriptional regulator [Bacilli bacterium]|nr:sigma-54-dependent Fis family transcriptional regulator [Bacilli bacterium]